MNGANEIKNGSIDVPYDNKGIDLKMFQSLKKKTWQYLDDYNSYINAMGKTAVDKLMDEL
jgi:ABC-type uncharacterized transport system YnjBCD substrate-binding protein